jgi:hypothetical protein
LRKQLLKENQGQIPIIDTVSIPSCRSKKLPSATHGTLDLHLDGNFSTIRAKKFAYMVENK